MLFSKKIILDTNFLLIPSQFKVDIFEEIRRIAKFHYKLFIFEDTLKELEKIGKEGKLKDKKAAKIAKSFIKLKNIGILKGKNSRDVDTQIVEYCKKYKVIVATQDLVLKKRLKNTRLIVLKSRKYLDFA